MFTHALGPIWSIKTVIIPPPTVNGLFVAVANAGDTDRVMTSPDGLTWTPLTSPEGTSAQWTDVTYGDNTYVAVAAAGTNRTMTSADGITWNSYPAASASPWVAVAWSPTVGLFVAVAATGGIMTSPTGTWWTLQTTPPTQTSQPWSAITWSPALGIFCAVASGGTAGIRVMTSPDGINWTAQSSIASPDGPWREITWSETLGLFVAVAQGNTSGGSHQVMTSPDGINWTSRTSADGNQWWTGVTWAPELNRFVAVSAGTNTDGGIGVTSNRVMTSPDGTTWTLQTDAGARTWRCVRWNGALFVAVANSGADTADERVMTSPDGFVWTERVTNDNGWQGLVWGTPQTYTTFLDTFSSDASLSGHITDSSHAWALHPINNTSGRALTQAVIAGGLLSSNRTSGFLSVVPSLWTMPTARPTFLEIDVESSALVFGGSLTVNIRENNYTLWTGWYITVSVNAGQWNINAYGDNNLVVGNEFDTFTADVGAVTANVPITVRCEFNADKTTMAIYANAVLQDTLVVGKMPIIDEMTLDIPDNVPAVTTKFSRVQFGAL
jgi:hypothetical protein